MLPIDLRALLEALSPTVCPLCLGPGHHQLGLCDICMGLMEMNPLACFYCAAPGVKSVCGQCQQQKTRRHRTLAPFLYRGSVALLVKRCKFLGERPICRYLGQLMAKAIAQQNLPDRPQALVPVPLSRQRFLERGFNQATDLANGLSRQLSVPCLTNIAKRTKSTYAQSSLATTLERRQNVADAFRITTQTGLNHIAIIDDVFTTGATSDSLATAFHDSGIPTIDIWTLARTP